MKSFKNTKKVLFLYQSFINEKKVIKSPTVLHSSRLFLLIPGRSKLFWLIPACSGWLWVVLSCDFCYKQHFCVDLTVYLTMLVISIMSRIHLYLYHFIILFCFFYNLCNLCNLCNCTNRVGVSVI